MKDINQTGGAWPIGAEVIIWGYPPYDENTIAYGEIVKVGGGRLAAICTATKTTINGGEQYPAAIIISDNGYFTTAEINLVQIVGKQSWGGSSRTMRLIRRILHFFSFTAKGMGGGRPC